MADVNPTSAESMALDPSHCAYKNLRAAMRSIGQVFDDAFRPVDLKATQFTMLAVIEQHDALPVTKLSEVLVMDRTTLSRNLKPLVAKGWIEIGREKDERVKLVSITDPGRRKVEEARPLWQSAQETVIARLGDHGMSQMLSILGKLKSPDRANQSKT